MITIIYGRWAHYYAYDDDLGVGMVVEYLGEGGWEASVLLER